MQVNVESLEQGHLLTDAVFLVAEARLGTDRRGQSYYSLTLNGPGGRQVDGKVWSDNIGEKIKPGHGIEVVARVDEFKGSRQLNIQRYHIIPPDKYDFSGYIRTADIDVDSAFDTLFNWDRQEFTNPPLKRLMKELFTNEAFASQFKTSPAASYHHHNYQGGLIEHTLEVWNLADALCELYDGRFDRDLMLCGAALHDIGKIKCYRLVSGISEQTDTRMLLDHIFISASMVSNLWDKAVRAELDADSAQKAATTKTLLLHIILSHHGQLEWGSPVLPQTQEAILVHYCDQISATMQACLRAADAVPEGESWTAQLSVMDHGRRLFVPGSRDED